MVDARSVMRGRTQMLKRMQHNVQEVERLRVITLTVHLWVHARRAGEQLSASAILRHQIH